MRNMGAEKRDGDQKPFENDDYPLSGEVDLVNQEMLGGQEP